MPCRDALGDGRCFDFLGGAGDVDVVYPGID
jgi:hypothetical protein